MTSLILSAALKGTIVLGTAWIVTALLRGIRPICGIASGWPRSSPWRCCWCRYPCRRRCA